MPNGHGIQNAEQHAGLPIQTELYIPAGVAGVPAVEHLCAQATNHHADTAHAVAVSPDKVSLASELLFGTGVGVVSMLDDRSAIVAQARMSLAAGATEISLPHLGDEAARMLADLGGLLGSSVPLTVDVSTHDGRADLAHAELALLGGADFVRCAPGQTPAPTQALIAMLRSSSLGSNRERSVGLKLLCAEPIKATGQPARWAAALRASRVCIPVTGPNVTFGPS